MISICINIKKYLEKCSKKLNYKPNAFSDEYVLYRKPQVPKQDALKEELTHFTNSITNAQKPETDGESAAKALALALEIQIIIGN